MTMAEEETTALTGGQLTTLQKSGLNKEQIKIVVHNFEELLATRKIMQDSVDIVVHNIVKDESLQKEFLSNPQTAVDKIMGSYDEVMRTR